MQTHNAFTNASMLGSSRAMGFEHEFTVSEVEVTATDAAAYLAARC